MMLFWLIGKPWEIYSCTPALKFVKLVIGALVFWGYFSLMYYFYKKGWKSQSLETRTNLDE